MRYPSVVCRPPRRRIRLSTCSVGGRHVTRRGPRASSGLQQAWAELQTLLDGRDVTSLETLAVQTPRCR